MIRRGKRQKQEIGNKENIIALRNIEKHIAIFMETDNRNTNVARCSFSGYAALDSSWKSKMYSTCAKLFDKCSYVSN